MAMRINRINKFFIVVAICFLGLSVYNVLSYRGWNRYFYDTTAIAPENYPVSIRECHFITADDDDDVYVKTNDVNDQNSKWTSEGDFLELRDKRLLPEKLFISYFSYREKRFYKGTFTLPTKTIEQIFEEAIRNKKTERHYSYDGQNRGLSFTVGVANNGYVLVWIRGIYLEKLILKVKLTPSEPESDDLYYETTLSKEAYVAHAFERMSDSVKLVLNKGFDSPANYADSATRYIENNTKLWEYQRKNGIIDYGK